MPFVAKKSARASAGTPALALLEREGVAHTLHPYDHDATAGLSFGMEAAESLGLDPARVFKTLVADVDGALTVAIVSVDRQLDLKALARAVGGKRAVLTEPHAAERATGYVVGGISPLGQKQRLATVVDDSALAFEAVYVSGGRRGLDVGLAPADLVRLTAATTAPLAR
ncbi:Cys-tRNA(Pro) deacylase [Microbacteriaceae bacterium 4G12]